jgi:hypothetical protein
MDQMNGFTNNGYGFGVPQGTGYQFNGYQPQQVPKHENWLSQEEIQKLVQKENGFSLQITETDRLRAGCNHRRQDGYGDAIVEDNDGVCRCQICGYEFRPIDVQTSKEELNDAVTSIVDILQTIKLLYIDMPADPAREFYQIIPLIEKIPKLFEYAAKDWLQHEQFNPYGYNSRNMNGMNLFNAVVGMLNGVGGQPNMGQPMNNGFQQQPNMYQQPMGNMYQQPQPGFNPAYAAPGSNGFGYMGQQPMGMGGYQPQQAGFQFNPQQAGQIVPAGATTPESTATADGKTVDVKADFKA